MKPAKYLIVADESKNATAFTVQGFALKSTFHSNGMCNVCENR